MTTSKTAPALDPSQVAGKGRPPLAVGARPLAFTSTARAASWPALSKAAARIPARRERGAGAAAHAPRRSRPTGGCRRAGNGVTSTSLLDGDSFPQPEVARAEPTSASAPTPGCLEPAPQRKLDRHPRTRRAQQFANCREGTPAMPPRPKASFGPDRVPASDEREQPWRRPAAPARDASFSSISAV